MSILTYIPQIKIYFHGYVNIILRLRRKEALSKVSEETSSKEGNDNLRDIKFIHLKYINEKLLNPDNSNNYWKRSANIQHLNSMLQLYNTLGFWHSPLIKIIFTNVFRLTAAVQIKCIKQLWNSEQSRCFKLNVLWYYITITRESTILKCEGTCGSESVAISHSLHWILITVFVFLNLVLLKMTEWLTIFISRRELY